MNSLRRNIEKSARYRLVAGLCGKRPKTVKAYFNRHRIDVLDDAIVGAYLAKNWKASIL